MMEIMTAKLSTLGGYITALKQKLPEAFPKSNDQSWPNSRVSELAFNVSIVVVNLDL